MAKIFVFGSNLAGRHGKGAAYEARKKWGARYGSGVGRTGSAYAIPTKDEKLRRLDLDTIRRHVAAFKRYAAANPNDRFLVTKIGCGLAGYSEEEVAPMFCDAPHNCELPEGWRK